MFVDLLPHLIALEQLIVEQLLLQCQFFLRSVGVGPSASKIGAAELTCTNRTQCCTGRLLTISGRIGQAAKWWYLICIRGGCRGWCCCCGCGTLRVVVCILVIKADCRI